MHEYSHLLTGAACGLECASCLHVDDIGAQVNIDCVMEYALGFFDEIDEVPKRISYHVSTESEHRRLSVSSFKRQMIGAGHSIGDTLRSMTITSDGFEGNATSDTWAPRSAVSVALHGKVLEAFIQAPRHNYETSRYLIKLAFEMFGASFAAAYIFPFPWTFSPISYGSGISYSPNSRQLGYLADRDSERVMNWANHCYRGHRASEGYLRDIYSLNIVGQKHLGMRVENSDLENWIRKNPMRGDLSAYLGKTLWEINSKHLLPIQNDLDDAGILLSAFSPS